MCIQYSTNTSYLQAICVFSTQTILTYLQAICVLSTQTILHTYKQYVYWVLRQYFILTSNMCVQYSDNTYILTSNMCIEYSDNTSYLQAICVFSTQTILTYLQAICVFSTLTILHTYKQYVYSVLRQYLQNRHLVMELCKNIFTNKNAI